MSPTWSYPGVYVEEIPPGMHPIPGVATSIAAFAGWAAVGPVGSVQMVRSFSDFVHEYGGLDSRSLLGYAVSHFFVNGGQQAYIVRLAGNDAAAAEVVLPAAGGALVLTARNPGQWANRYGVVITNKPGEMDRFRLRVVYASRGPVPTVVESFEDLSMTSPDPQGRYVGDVLRAHSAVMTGAVAGAPSAPPGDTAVPQMLAGGADGTVLTPASPAGAFEAALLPADGTGGAYLLELADLFNLLCVPGEADPPTLQALEKFCRRRRAFLIADSAQADTFRTLCNGPSPAITGDDAVNAALYFPWLHAPDSLSRDGTGSFPPSGFVAGIYARTDVSQGVWKAPAGSEARVRGATGITVVPLSDDQNGRLNSVAVNCIRNVDVQGPIVWGARTLRGSDERGFEWKYVPVRRLALYIEESVNRGTRWAVFEPNGESLWAQLRLSVGAFMQDLFLSGALQGQTPQEAYFVKCDKDTTTQDDIEQGLINIVVGFAPLKAAEFVVIRIQQMVERA